MNIKQRIEQQLKDSPVVLYMKGTADFPQCGFSARAIDILQNTGVAYVTYNVLEDPELREGIKEYGDWPTIPQLYVNGQLIGGSDIMLEFFESGELEELLKDIG